MHSSRLERFASRNEVWEPNNLAMPISITRLIVFVPASRGPSECVGASCRMPLQCDVPDLVSVGPVLRTCSEITIQKSRYLIAALLDEIGWEYGGCRGCCQELRFSSPAADHGRDDKKTMGKRRVLHVLQLSLATHACHRRYPTCH